MLRHFFLIVTVLLAIPSPAQDRSYGRSMVVTNGGIAATSQYLASQAGADVLRRGGSAIDGAIAARFLQEVKRLLEEPLGLLV